MCGYACRGIYYREEFKVKLPSGRGVSKYGYSAKNGYSIKRCNSCERFMRVGNDMIVCCCCHNRLQSKPRAHTKSMREALAAY
jgi:hypothetical protein